MKIPLKFTGAGRNEGTPSIDRIDNNLGYVKGNIGIISWRANFMKRDFTVEQVRSLLEYMEKK